MFALLIGINEYLAPTGYHALRGAEPDARRWRDLLKEHGCPDSNINLLLGRSASRETIVNAFKSLACNAAIQFGDPIVIFYAGHGGEVLYKTSDGGSHTIQMVVPFDYCTERGKEVPCISDMEIGALIDCIAAKKGDNITVIMDCCHSASGTRGGDDDGIRTRSIDLPSSAYNPAVVGEGSSGMNIGTRYSRAGIRSHMLLAACASNEKAHEDKCHGRFSAALLDLFRTVPLHHLRYCDILPRMRRIAGQNPQCEGFNKQRYLFNSGLCNYHKVEFRKHNGESSSARTTDTESLILHAGSIHGILVGDHFDLYYVQTDFSLTKTGNIATVKSVDAFSSIMEHAPEFYLHYPSVAIRIKSGQKEEPLRIFVSRNDRFRSLFNNLRRQIKDGYQLQDIQLVDETGPTGARLQVSMEHNGKVLFSILDERATRFGFRKRLPNVDAKELANVLRGAAHYYRELDRFNDRSTLSRGVSVEFYKLDDSDEWDWRKFRPMGPNLFRDGVVDFEVENGAPYGFKLVNNGARDLYPYIFYFNNSDLSIGSIYEASGPTDYLVESSLKSGGFLTFGYGSGGVPPHAYELDDETGDVDFLKIFFTTRAIDSFIMSQPSPLQPTRAPTAYIPRFSDGEWDTLIIPIVQRKPRP